MAIRLLSKGYSVLIVESGGVVETDSSRDLNKGSADPPGSHEPLQENRRRQWGGASAVWGGRCIPFDELDFAERSWVDHSGWPFGRSELDRYYIDAMRLCEAGRMDFDAHTALPSAPEFLPGLDGDGLVTYALERWSSPTHFGKRYRKLLASSSSTLIILNATCTHIQLSPSGEDVAHIRVENPIGECREVSARFYVIAAGGLENARLLLASRDVSPNGIGNHSDCLGRFYQTHLFGCHARLVLADGAPRAHVAFDRDEDGVYCRRRVWFEPPTQEAAQMLNTVFFPTRPPLGATGHRSALFSGVYLAKTLIAAARRPATAMSFLRSERDALLSHGAVFFRELPRAVPELLRVVLGRFGGSRRLPAVLPPDGERSYYLQFQAEQTPNPAARLVLSTECDAFGMPRLVVAPRVTAEDVDSVLKAHRMLDRRLRKTGLGMLEYDEGELYASVVRSTRQVNSAAHHLGTTRMSTNPTHGVVNPNCKVHGVSNLYAVGGSVFPTSGHANPTLTVVALALRLADHLASQSGESRD